jgi:pyridoxamine 5'-phosphate oxidase
MVEYEDFRREYLAGGLTSEMLDQNPIAQFKLWLDQAVEGGVRDPTAMVLATVSDDGSPWQRIVLLKGVSTEGFVFYSNYQSAKARAMEAEPRVSAHFPWNQLDRQVIVAGKIEKISTAQSQRYFQSRPRESQLAAWASLQSQPIANRGVLEEQVEAIQDKFGAGDIPLPDFWGGYRVVPNRIEFWQGGAHRLHDRFVYQLLESGHWNIEQLQP